MKYNKKRIQRKGIDGEPKVSADSEKEKVLQTWDIK